MTIQHGQNRPHRSLALPIILLSLLIALCLAGLYMLNQASPGAREIGHLDKPAAVREHTVKPRPIGVLVPRPVGVVVPRPVGVIVP